VAKREVERLSLLATQCFPSRRCDLGRPKQRWKDEGRLIERIPEQFVMMMVMTTTMMMMMMVMTMISIYE